MHYRLKLLPIVLNILALILFNCDKDDKSPTGPDNDKQTLSCRIDVLGDLDFSDDVGSQYGKNIERNGKFYNLIWCRGDAKLNDKTIYLVFQLWSTSEINSNLQFNIASSDMSSNKGFWLHVVHYPDGSVTYELESGTLKLESFNAEAKTASGVFTGSGHTGNNQSFTLTNGKFTLKNMQTIG